MGGGEGKKVEWRVIGKRKGTGGGDEGEGRRRGRGGRGKGGEKRVMIMYDIYVENVIRQYIE